MPGLDFSAEGNREVETAVATGLRKEQVNNEDEGQAEENGDKTKPYVREGHFELLSLPAELRIHIYSYLLPHNLIFSFVRISRSGMPRTDNPGWYVETASRESGDNVPAMAGSRHRHERMSKGAQKWPRVEAQLFLINKEVSKETLAVLYGSNTYTFTINAQAHFPVSLNSLLIFGPFGNRNGRRLPLLRNLRSICIDVIWDAETHWAVTRQRSRLDFIVDVLKQHADDHDRKSLLEELHVQVRLPDLSRNIYYSSRGHFIPLLPPSDPEKFMFSVESLAALRGINDVRISGLPDWYAQCLKVCIQGKGGDIHEIEWPLVQVKRSRTTSKGSIKTKVHTVSTRKWYNPTLDWKEFAQRNNIDIPADIDKYWRADG